MQFACLPLLGIYYGPVTSRFFAVRENWRYQAAAQRSFFFFKSPVIIGRWHNPSSLDKDGTQSESSFRDDYFSCQANYRRGGASGGVGGCIL